MGEQSKPKTLSSADAGAVLEQTLLLRKSSSWLEAEEILERLARVLRGRRAASEIRLEIAWHYEEARDFDRAIGHYMRLRRCRFARLAAAAAHGVARIRWNQGHHTRSV